MGLFKKSIAWLLIIGLGAQFFQAAPWLLFVFGGALALGVYLNNYRKQKAEIAAINELGTQPLGNILEPIMALNANGSKMLMGSSTFDFEVVGESFYKQNYAALQKNLSLSDGQDWDEIAVLIADPGNNSSKTAVAVFVSGLKLGYVPETHSAGVFRFLLQHGGQAKADAAIYFSAHDSMNSLWLDIAFPLTVRR
jgi:hypothetical protein